MFTVAFVDNSRLLTNNSDTGFSFDFLFAMQGIVNNQNRLNSGSLQAGGSLSESASHIILKMNDLQQLSSVGK